MTPCRSVHFEQIVHIMLATAKTSTTLTEFIAHATKLASLQCVGSFPPAGQGNVQPEVSSFKLQASNLKPTNCSTNFRPPFFEWHCELAAAIACCNHEQPSLSKSNNLWHKSLPFALLCTQKLDSINCMEENASHQKKKSKNFFFGASRKKA